MITLQGRYRDGQSARVVDMRLAIAEDGSLDAEPPLPPGGNLRLVELDSRIAGLPATLRFPWGGVFETTDHDGVEAAFDAIGRPSGLLYRLENRLRYVISAVVFTFCFVVAAYLWGVPALSAAVTPLVPVSVGNALGEGALEQLDRLFFEPSELSPERAAELQRVFANLRRDVQLDFEPKLALRRGGFFNANALALPDGTIVLTDELVALAEHDRQLAAVFLHEFGHVQRRHSLRQLLNQSSVAALTFLLVGDVSTVSTLVAALPAVLLQTSYSRGMEIEADDFAVANAGAGGVTPNDLADMLARLDRHHRNCRRVERRDGPVAAEECMVRDDGGDGAAEDDDWTSYASTHPATGERIERILSDSAARD